VAVYLPLSGEPGPHVLAGAQRAEADLRRVAIAREALISRHPYVPAWDGRQFTGVPFCADLRNFPWIPNRLALLAVPERSVYDVAVALAAALAAVFTYAYARRLGFAALAAAVAGWTFAAAQLLAGRVAAGELPVIETFAALPLMLWLVERSVQIPPDQPGQRGRALVALGLATMCIALGGDGRLPAIAIIAAAIYAIYRARRAGWRAVLAMLLGIGCAAFALWPMLLWIRRSIQPPTPSRDPMLTSALAFAGEFARLDRGAAYVGIAPILAVFFVLIAWFLRSWPRNRVWRFLLGIGVVALGIISALLVIRPTARWATATVGLYVLVFALAITLGLAIQLLNLRCALKRPGLLRLLVAVIVVLHVADMVWHDRAVIRSTAAAPTTRPIPMPSTRPAQLTTFASLPQRLGEGRIAIDPKLWGSIDVARQLDDLSAPGPRLPARSQRVLAELNDAHDAPLPATELAAVDASALSPRALSAAGVRLVLTSEHRPDLPSERVARDVQMYRVPNPASRAAFYPAGETHVLPAEQIHQRIRELDLRRTLLLPSSPSSAAPAAAPEVSPDQSWAAAVRYRRPRGDEIALSVKSGVDGYVRVLESFDPGWDATVDGQTAPVLAADDAWLAVAVPQGAHEVLLRYHTPGAQAGAIASGISFVLLLVVSFVHRREPEPIEDKSSRPV
jgi:MFS family permease